MVRCFKAGVYGKHHQGEGVDPLSSEFADILAESLEQGSFIELVLSKKITGDAAAPEKVTARAIIVKGQSLVQFASRIGPQEFHENLPAEQAVARVDELLRETFEHAHLFTSEADMSARVQRGGGIRIHRSPPTRQAASSEHDRRKQHLIPEGEPCPFLVEIGVMTPAGKVKASKRQKFRQINRFLELVDDVVDVLPPDKRLEVVDFGCGKSYLTFALHHLLQHIHKRDVAITGLDRNAGVIRDCSRIADRLDCRGLEFHVGTIAEHVTQGDVDLAVSLHACDTATDDALAQAVRWKAGVILAVPCCQHELADKIHSDSPSAIEEYGILRERQAALATDALRAEALEISGYRTQVVEFIDMEHTAKNLLIRSVRREASVADVVDHVRAYRKLKTALGLGEIYLEKAFGPQFREKVCRQD